jgi:hypothetical protein
VISPSNEIRASGAVENTTRFGGTIRETGNFDARNPVELMALFAPSAFQSTKAPASKPANGSPVLKETKPARTETDRRSPKFHKN